MVGAGRWPFPLGHSHPLLALLPVRGLCLRRWTALGPKEETRTIQHSSSCCIVFQQNNWFSHRLRSLKCSKYKIVYHINDTAGKKGVWQYFGICSERADNALQIVIRAAHQLAVSQRLQLQRRTEKVHRGHHICILLTPMNFISEPDCGSGWILTQRDFFSICFCFFVSLPLFIIMHT